MQGDHMLMSKPHWNLKGDFIGHHGSGQNVGPGCPRAQNYALKIFKILEYPDQGLSMALMQGKTTSMEKAISCLPLNWTIINAKASWEGESGDSLVVTLIGASCLSSAHNNWTAASPLRRSIELPIAESLKWERCSDAHSAFRLSQGDSPIVLLPALIFKWRWHAVSLGTSLCLWFFINGLGQPKYCSRPLLC